MKYDLPPEVMVEEDGPVRVVTLNRPESLNSVNEGLHRGIASVWRQIAADPDARAAVLTGAGSAFCAGGDMTWFGAVRDDPELRVAVMRQAKEVVHELVRFPLPLVGAVNGAAVGLGCSVAVMCDIVLMADNAFLADPHVAVGLVAGDGGAVTWPLFMSLLKAKEYLFTGERIKAETAERLGLANRVVPAAELRDEAMHPGPQAGRAAGQGTPGHQAGAQPPPPAGGHDGARLRHRRRERVLRAPRAQGTGRCLPGPGREAGSERPGGRGRPHVLAP